jgi:hypothetical protein
MEVHTFGEKNKPVLVLLHAFGMHWSQWNNIADGLKGNYYIIVPSLEGHEDANRTTLFMFYCAHNLTLMKALSIPKIYGGLDNTKVLWSTMRSISFKTARNVFYGVDIYPLPRCPQVNIQTKTAYWYGSFERKEREKMAARLKEKFPDLETKMFNGYRHAQLCLDDPKRFITSVEEYLQDKNTNA